MPQVSKVPLKPEYYQRIFELLSSSISKLNSQTKVQNFFQDFFTPTEKIMFAKRISIAYLLARKYNYRDISQILKVSTATVSTVANRYNNAGEFRGAISKLVRDQNFERSWSKLLEVSIGTLSSVSRKTSVWKELDRENRKKIKPF